MPSSSVSSTLRHFTRSLNKSKRQPHSITAASITESVPDVLSEVEIWDKTRRLQTQVFNVGDDTVCIRSLDWDRDRFDIEFGLQNGTTYNSYLIFGEKTALVDASHEKFVSLYLKTLKKELKKQGRNVDYIIVSHTEPDHSGLVPEVLDLYPEAIVLGTKVCIQFLKGLTNRSFKSQVVKGGDKVDLGNGHEIEFFPAPNLHWPDTMFSFDPVSRILYTCDAFGLHYCSKDPFDSHLKDIDSHYRFYYDCLMRPNARSVLTALKRISDVPYQMIGNGHGPLLRYNVPELVERYRSWSASIGKAPASVALLYSSDYGFSDRLSQSIAKGVTKSGVATEMVDVLSIDPQELVEILGRNSGVVVMCPPTHSEEAQKSISLMMSAVKPKQKVIIAESFGGEDEPVDTLRSSLVGVGVEPLLDPLRVKQSPDETVYQAFEEAGTDLAQSLTKKANVKKMKEGMSLDISKALAKISSGLYVVTAARGNAKSAMIASWVSQASFKPLGFTIAVAKDRAIESLLQVGDEFVLNCLGETNYAKTMKHFLQRFGPGQDRFEGIEWFSADNGSPVLVSAIAYLECKVASRMETPDHWITYCTVKDGKVSDPTAKTAVHRRMVANYY
eukprot:g1865.t1